MELALLKRDKVTLALTATATLVGLSPYLYLVVRSNSKAIDGWGDQSTLSGFLTHFLRREYGTFALASEWESGEEQDGDKVVRRLILNAKQFNEDTLYLGGIAAARFAWGAGIRGNRAGVVAVVCWLGYSVFFNYLANLTFSKLHLNILGRMWQQCSVAGFAIGGAGAGMFMGGSGSLSRSLRVLVPLLSVVPLFLNFRAMDRSHVSVFSSYARNVLSGLPANATLMVNDDMNCNTLHYMIRCEGTRQDVNLLKIPLITYDWWKPMQLEHFPNVRGDGKFPGTRHHPYDPEGFDMKTFLDVNVGREDAELYVAGDWKQGDNTQDVYQRVPVGLADKVVAPGEEVELYEFAKALSKNLDKVGRFDKETTIDVVEGSWELVMRIKYQVGRWSELEVPMWYFTSPILTLAFLRSS